MEKQKDPLTIEHDWAYMEDGQIGWLCPFCGNVKDDIFIIPDGRLVCVDCMTVWQDSETATKH